ncbi:glutamate ABC transporter substrate-binding protein [Actinomadura hibisca]|uniref:glutamate ABC transporter substrate-binding protein n=1 Tax=Actinomadura hibisca TaxID=68565 RepID=UPI00082AC5F2|nr:glutamate ABC transporter substrate-binding protein [Actinomadura hibisca]
MRARRTTAALAALAAAALGAAGCGVTGAEDDSILGKDTLTIGVSPDQPGLGQLTGSTREGFDIDVAREVAKRLGVDASSLRFKNVTSASREEMLERGEVDLVVATYSITPERKTRVAFAGPYYVAHQDILVRGETTDIRNVRNLAGKRLCEVPGSVSFPRVTKEKGIAAVSAQASGYSDCLAKLQAGQLDAVSTDDLILAGLAAQALKSGGRPLKIVNSPFTDEPYGIGVRKDDTDGCEAVNKAITTMYQDGTAPKLLNKWFRLSRLDVVTTVPQFEGCD